MTNVSSYRRRKTSDCVWWLTEERIVEAKWTENTECDRRLNLWLVWDEMDPKRSSIYQMNLTQQLKLFDAKGWFIRRFADMGLCTSNLWRNLQRRGGGGGGSFPKFWMFLIGWICSILYLLFSIQFTTELMWTDGPVTRFRPRWPRMWRSISSGDLKLWLETMKKDRSLLVVLSLKFVCYLLKDLIIVWLGTHTNIVLRADGHVQFSCHLNGIYNKRRAQ